MKIYTDATIATFFTSDYQRTFLPLTPMIHTRAFLLVLILVSTLLSARAQDSGANSVRTEKRPIRDVRAVKVDHGIDLYIRQGDREELTLEADPGAMEYFTSEVNDGTLTLSLNKNFIKTKILKAHLTMRTLERIESSGGSNVYSEGVLQGEKMLYRASGGSDVKLELSVKDLTVQTSGGADAIIKGLAATLNVTASGGSDFDGRELHCDYAAVNASGAADVHVYVDLDLEANASGAASVYYYGNPRQVNTNTSGGGDVKKR